jgi:FkbM family methyltransferase
MLDSEHVEGVVTLHALGGSNESQRVPIVRSMPPGDERQGILTDRKLERFNRANATVHVQTVALDDFFRSQSLRSIYQVSIDTEGWDALVIEGMRDTILNRRVAVVEFEVNQLGYWSRNRPDHRTVRGTLSMFHAAGEHDHVSSNFATACVPPLPSPRGAGAIAIASKAEEPARACDRVCVLLGARQGDAAGLRCLLRRAKRPTEVEQCRLRARAARGGNARPLGARRLFGSS